MTYSAPAEVIVGQKIEVADYNLLCTDMIDHETRIVNVASGGTGVTNIPVGGIIMWAGTLASLAAFPEWKLCDGTNGTPNLKNFFIVGASSTYDPDDKGGDLLHGHAVSASNSGGSHTHTASLTTGGPSATQSAVATPIIAVGSSGHSHSASLSTGGASSTHTHGVPDTNDASGLPPYRGVYYIMRYK